MHALIVFESMYGATHAIADGIAAGLRDQVDVRVMPVGEATPEQLAWADAVIVGGPTHGHGMSRAMTRRGAIADAATPEKHLELDPSAGGPGVRDWLDALPDGSGRPAAAFDTRGHYAAILTGRASGGIEKGLKRHGYRLVAPAESFFVGDTSHLMEGEVGRAASWGTRLAVMLGGGDA